MFIESDLRAALQAFTKLCDTATALLVQKINS